jgi:hypothetical protein
VNLIPIAGIPAPGVLAFSPSEAGGILVRFANNGSFRVFNGEWSGMYDGTNISHRDHNGVRRVDLVEPFGQVLELTDSEKAHYYFTGTIKLPPSTSIDIGGGIPF